MKQSLVVDDELVALKVLKLKRLEQESDDNGR